MDKKKDDAEREVKDAADAREPNSAALPTGLQKKKYKKWPWILVVVFGLIVAAGVAFIVTVKPFDKKDHVDEINQVALPTHFDSPDAIIEVVNPRITGKILDAVRSDGAGAIGSDGTIVYTLPLYRADGRQFGSIPKAGVGVGSAMDETAASASYLNLVDFFAENNFELLTTDNQTSPVFGVGMLTSISYAVYSSDEIICAISHTDATKVVADQHRIGIGCARVSEYMQSAKILDPFFTAYTKRVNGKESDKVMLGMPAAYMGAVGYDSAVIPQIEGDRIASSAEQISQKGYYYKPTASNEWTFVAIAQDIPSCGQFVSDTAKKAFQGLACLGEDAKTQSTVR